MGYARVVVLCLSVFWAGSLTAAQGIELLRFNPQLSIAKVYHSFKEGFLLVSLEPRAPKQFSCEPNHYLIYQTKTEQLHRIAAGNLRVSSDFHRLVYLKVQQISKPKTPNWAVKAQQISQRLQASPALLADAAMQDSAHQCWQQPVLMDTQSFQGTELPVIAANLCKHRWCSELSFTPKGELNLWVTLEPKQVQRLVFQGTELLHSSKKSAKFTKENLKLAAAPRVDLLAGKKLGNLQFPLLGGRRLILKKQGSWVVMYLLRSKPNRSLAALRLKEAQRWLAEKQPKKAFQQAQMAVWLNPANFAAKYLQLVSLAGDAGIGPLFRHLKQDFTESEQKKACGKIHLDPAFQSLKRQRLFLDQFKQSCPSAFSPVF